MPKQWTKIAHKQDVFTLWTSLWSSILPQIKPAARGVLQQLHLLVRPKTLSASRLCKWHTCLLTTAWFNWIDSDFHLEKASFRDGSKLQKESGFPSGDSFEGKKPPGSRSNDPTQMVFSSMCWEVEVRDQDREAEAELDLVLKVLLVFLNRKSTNVMNVFVLIPTTPTHLLPINLVLLKVSVI